ncbi:hypothetical protein DSECCO2_496350 [anaerobic digester metagenome]
MLARFDTMVSPALFTKLASIISVPVEVPEQVKLALPAASVIAVPLWPALGPETTEKLTGFPARGFPLSSCTRDERVY